MREIHGKGQGDRAEAGRSFLAWTELFEAPCVLKGGPAWPQIHRPSDRRIGLCKSVSRCINSLVCRVNKAEGHEHGF
jgi:hypothetical protein